MKKFLFFLLIVWQINALEAQTNVYHPFPAANAIWNVSYQDYWNYNCQNYSCSIPDDTIIGSVTYHKIWKQGKSLLMIDNSPNPLPVCTNQITSTYSYYAGAIREDLPQKKIYFLQPSSTTEQLLYDFTLNVGDTIKGYFSSNFPPPLIIQYIDSTLIGTQYRKTWHIDPSNGWGGMPQIIEGIGSIYGLLGTPYTYEKTWIVLECFSQNDQTLYPSYNAANGCALITSVKEKNEFEGISVYPNPTSGKFQLKFNNQKIVLLEITDVLGKIILKKQLEKETTNIDLSAHPNGIYFVKAFDSKGNFVMKKIVKQ